MAYQVEDIFKEFNEAMEVYRNAMEAMQQSYAQLKAAESKLLAVHTAFLDFMGEQEYYNTGADISFSLLRQVSNSERDFGKLFDIGGWF